MAGASGPTGSGDPGPRLSLIDEDFPMIRDIGESLRDRCLQLVFFTPQERVR
jgi:hypothetical protein